ncbi:protein kinase, putative [Perkinsus marinus ATCC 50983]|uniref:Protein kinase, putative n=1 Tax=Perkinsus marinus (strain ATCC 50983 / TXsc) TaxID=423536 RepID=C5KUL3_PERM5|nr:protein kinase, putative [Perkinsus marinus ATCC 50983]EER11831.1 protein kinase, putative [Perkinsus marinus ATCC 50983]|eukprot:XP_002780036.1 protein kinase, putative [Perkinsus marinus ATCC 50983]
MHLENKKELQQQAERLGKLMPSTRSATGHHWKGGTEEKSILDAHKRLQSFKAQLDEEKTQYRKLLRIRRARANTEGNATAAPEVSSSSSAMVQDEDTNTKILGLADMLPTDEAEYQIHEAKENIQMMEMTLKKTESDLVERENRLHAERTLFNKELRTCNSHEQSAFGNYPCLGKSTDGLLPGRYQLMTMIGKGGFSEVFKAYDLETHSYVAVKIHQIRPDMTEVAREAYVRHTWREYGIHKRLKHRRIIQLYDYFPIDCHSFGTVLEFCEGVDLDTYLKAHGPIPEKEARGIMVQVFSGLRYMNSAGHKIIHYDLKPGNLMYYEGNIKITDFGLSKQVDQHQNHDTVELTSLGTGTYWYLPPECFDTSAAKISNKVDVWSCGVIFYELLFARKPFGESLKSAAFCMMSFRSWD